MRKSVGIISIGIVFASMTSLSISDKIKQSIKDEIPVISKRTKATPQEKKENKRIAKEFAWVGYGWKGKEWVCLDRIFYKEAKYDHLAKNQSGSSAYGIGQRLKETSKDPMIQLLHTYKYIQHRYKNPCSAWRFHVRKNYY